jgi:hypothetical protein
MREVFILIAHLLVTLVRLARPRGLGAVAAESLAVKHQLLIMQRAQRRAPKLTCLTQVDTPSSQEAVRAAVQSPRPGPNLEALRQHPLAAWVETTFGIELKDGRLERHTPIMYREGLDKLVAATKLPIETCDAALKPVLQDGNAAKFDRDEPIDEDITDDLDSLLKVYDEYVSQKEVSSGGTMDDLHAYP